MTEATHTPEPAVSHVLRGDAERNRRKILDVSAGVFAEDGFEVSMDHVAHVANLGKGTLFRHFPTKECLITAVVITRLHDLLDRTSGLTESEDPAAALRQFMRTAIDLVAGDKALLDGLHGLATADPDVGMAKAQVFDRCLALLDRAQAAGAVRSDINACDLMLLVNAIGRVTVPFRGLDPDLWTRYLDLVFQGLAPGGERVLSHPPPSRELMAQCMDRSAVAFRAKLHGNREQ